MKSLSVAIQMKATIKAVPFYGANWFSVAPGSKWTKMTLCLSFQVCSLYASWPSLWSSPAHHFPIWKVSIWRHNQSRGSHFIRGTGESIFSGCVASVLVVFCAKEEFSACWLSERCPFLAHSYTAQNWRTLSVRDPPRPTNRKLIWTKKNLPWQKY